MALLKPSPDVPASENFTRLGALADAAIDASAKANDVTVDSAQRPRVEELTLAARPGDASRLFTDVLSGGEPSRLPVIGADPAFGDDGAVVRTGGAAVIAMRGLVAVEDGRFYRLRAVVRRRGNAIDPSDDAVRIAVRWFDQAKNPLVGASGVTILEDILDLKTSDGRRTAIATLATAAGSGIAAVIPPAACYGAAYVQVYGGLQLTDVEVLDFRDVSDATIWAPNVSAFDARLVAQESLSAGDRLDTLESEVGNPHTLTFPTFADANAASVPANVTTVRTLGYYQSGDEGGGIYVRASGAPAHPLYIHDQTGGYFVLASEELALPQAGAKDDDVFDNTAALAAMRSFVGATGRPIRLPRVAAGRYVFAGVAELAGLTLDPDPAVAIVAAGYDYSPTARMLKRLPAEFTVQGASAPSAYEFAVDFGASARAKSLWLGEGDIDRSRTLPIDCTTLNHVFINGDSWVDAAPASVEAKQVIWALGADGTIRASLTPVHGGQDIEASWSTGNYSRGAVIRTTEAYYYFSAALTGSASLLTKVRYLGSGSSGPWGWPGISTHGSYFPGNAVWGVRILDSRSFCITINGYEAFGPWSVVGEIIEAGFGFTGSVSATVGVAHWSRTYRACADGGSMMNLLVMGDSLSEPIHGGWPEAMADALQGSFGLRVNALVNYAKGGHASFQQRDKLATLGPPPGTTHAVVLLPTNDISGGASADDFTAGYMTDIIDNLQAFGIKPLILIPPLFYPRELAGGAGIATSRYEAGARTRTMLKRLASSKGCKVLDLNHRLGPVLGDYAQDPCAVLRDNLHPSAYAYKVIGFEAAKALAGISLRSMTPEVADGALPTVPLLTGQNGFGLANGWTQGDLPLRYSAAAAADGLEVGLYGKLLPGDRGSPITILRLPASLRPLRATAQLALSDAANISLVAQPDGLVSVSGMASSGSYVLLDGLRFPVAG